MKENIEYTLLVDREDNEVGKKLRGYVTKDDIYRVSSLWVFNRKKELLIAQRPLWKKHDQGKWTESAVGTVEFGETYETNIVKEAREELGMDLDVSHLIFITKEYYESENGKMFGAIFALVLEDEPQLNINTEEVPAIEWISHDSLVHELSRSDHRFVGGFDQYYYKVWDDVSTF